MKFDIEKSFSKKDIIKNRKKEKIFKKMLYILSFIVSVAFFPFFYEITQNEFSGILEAIIYATIVSVFVGGLFFLILLFSTANKHKFSFQHFEYIEHKKCTNLLKSAEMNPEIKNYAREMKRMYDEDLIYNLPEYHDSYIWDHVRKKFEEERGTQNNNIGDNGKGHIQARCVLGQYYDHTKGPKRKSYGFSTENNTAKLKRLEAMRRR